jgi:hypothetical protein
VSAPMRRVLSDDVLIVLIVTLYYLIAIQLFS